MPPPFEPSLPSFIPPGPPPGPREPPNPNLGTEPDPPEPGIPWGQIGGWFTSPTYPGPLNPQEPPEPPPNAFKRFRQWLTTPTSPWPLPNEPMVPLPWWLNPPYPMPGPLITGFGPGIGKQFPVPYTPPPSEPELPRLPTLPKSSKPGITLGGEPNPTTKTPPYGFQLPPEKPPASKFQWMVPTEPPPPPPKNNLLGPFPPPKNEPPTYPGGIASLPGIDPGSNCVCQNPPFQTVNQKYYNTSGGFLRHNTSMVGGTDSGGGGSLHL